MYPRTPGDFFPDGTQRNDRLAEVLEAVDLLISVNAYDANPPRPASELLQIWENQAGILGRIWARYNPPPLVQTLKVKDSPVITF